MAYEIALYEERAQWVASRRERIPPSEVPGFIARALGSLTAHLAAAGMEPAGELTVRYHELGADAIDLEACLPIQGPAPDAADVTVHAVPARTVARTLHVGRYEDLPAAYEALVTWIGGHGLAPVGPVAERYLNGPDDVASDAEYRTEIEVPVQGAAVPAEAGRGVA